VYPVGISVLSYPELCVFNPTAALRCDIRL
jgi:hypothetical protein